MVHDAAFDVEKLIESLSNPISRLTAVCTINMNRGFHLISLKSDTLILRLLRPQLLPKGCYWRARAARAAASSFTPPLATGVLLACTKALSAQVHNTTPRTRILPARHCIKIPY